LRQIDIYAKEFNTKKYYLFGGKTKRLPMGMSFEFFSFELLEEAYQNSKNKIEHEHVTPYMHQNMPGDIDIFHFQTSLNSPQLRLTVDTKDDFKLIQELILKYDCQMKSLEEIIQVFQENKYLEKINSNVIQKKWNE
jgi:spore coat polysaccharide biosynthesis protein SpsF